MKNSNSTKGTDTIYLDFAKAFDKVDHQILLKKLHKIGIRGNLLRWIQAFLSDRFQEVSVEGFKSFIFAVISGVIQGSVLGPILFLVFINDISQSVQNSSVKCFADDTRISRPIESLYDAELLQNDLDQIMTWCTNNNMELNENKFEFLRTSYKIEKSMLELSFCYYETCYKTFSHYLIESKDQHQVKDLGVTFSSTQNFKPHIADIVL